MLDPLYIDPLYIYSTEKVHLNRITDKSNLVLVPWEILVLVSKSHYKLRFLAIIINVVLLLAICFT